MDASGKDSANPLSLKELIFVKSKNNIAERVKNFLPQIAKANAELEEADEETRQAMIIEQIEQLKDDSSSDESDDSSTEGKSSESDDDEEKVEVIFSCFYSDMNFNKELTAFRVTTSKLFLQSLKNANKAMSHPMKKRKEMKMKTILLFDGPTLPAHQPSLNTELLKL